MAHWLLVAREDLYLLSTAYPITATSQGVKSPQLWDSSLVKPNTNYRLRRFCAIALCFSSVDRRSMLLAIFHGRQIPKIFHMS